jgi:hypothetical protein
MPVLCEPSQCHLCHTGYSRYLPLNKRGHSLYVSRLAYLFQSLYPTLGYRRALAGETPDPGTISLRDFLTNLHKDITTCWNFEDEEHVRYYFVVMSHTLDKVPR